MAKVIRTGFEAREESQNRQCLLLPIKSGSGPPQSKTFRVI